MIIHDSTDVSIKKAQLIDPGRELLAWEVSPRDPREHRHCSRPLLEGYVDVDRGRGQGLLAHYCQAIVHWNLPGNPVDLEQREGRVHRYKGHAIRKNVAAEFGSAALATGVDHPWRRCSRPPAPRRQRPVIPTSIRSGSSPDPCGAVIERYVPALPLSSEVGQYRRLQRTVGAYRLLMGQSQDDLIRHLGEDASWLQIDLAPPSG